MSGEANETPTDVKADPRMRDLDPRFGLAIRGVLVLPGSDIRELRGKDFRGLLRGRLASGPLGQRFARRVKQVGEEVGDILLLEVVE